MTFAADAAEIRQAFASGFAALRPAVPIVFDNQSFDPPPNAPWVRLSIRPAEASRLDVGGPTVAFAVEGTVFVQVFISASLEGDGEALEIADDAAAALADRRLTNVVMRTPALRHVGRDGDWYQLNVTVPYRSTRKR